MDDGTTILSAPMRARSGREQQKLARRRDPGRAGRSAGAVEDAGDVAWVGDNIEDVHAAAALATDGDGDGEDAGEQGGPADAARSGGGLGGGAPRVVIVEAQGELLAGGGDDRRREDARAEVMAAGEDAKIPGHVEAWRRDEGAQPGQELVGAHVGVGGTAAPRSLEVDAHPTVRECLDGVMGERRAQQVATHTFEPFSVAAVDGRRCMQVHAQRPTR